MADIESLLNRWLSAGVVDATTAARIRAHEQDQEHHSGLRWQGLVALILGGLLLACGVVLFVSAHWDQLGSASRLLLAMAMVAVFHLGGGGTRAAYPGLSTTLHAVGTVAAGAAIALVGQIFNMQEHWPAAVLLWALCAIAGWVLLRDQAQQTLALLLAPAWFYCELEYASEGHIGHFVYLGRFLLLWAVLYFILFLNSKRKVVQGILFAASAIAALVGTGMMLDSWSTFSAEQSFIPFGVTVWAWIAMGALPFCAAAFKGHKGLLPMVVALGYALILPWCSHTQTVSYNFGNGNMGNYTTTTPNLAAYALVAAFAVYVCSWGVRQSSRALVNFGIVGFAIAVAWFYYSNIFSALGRSLGLIGLGVLFLAGGWALERLRRRILVRMDSADAAREAL
jgi:uncharacterized membrane protein